MMKSVRRISYPISILLSDRVLENESISYWSQIPTGALEFWDASSVIIVDSRGDEYNLEKVVLSRIKIIDHIRSLSEGVTSIGKDSSQNAHIDLMLSHQKTWDLPDLKQHIISFVDVRRHWLRPHPDGPNEDRYKYVMDGIEKAKTVRQVFACLWDFHDPDMKTLMRKKLDPSIIVDRR